MCGPFSSTSKCTEGPLCCETTDAMHQPLWDVAGLAGSEGNFWLWEGERSMGGDWSNGVERAREVSLRQCCGVFS